MQYIVGKPISIRIQRCITRSFLTRPVTYFHKIRPTARDIVLKHTRYVRTLQKTSKTLGTCKNIVTNQIPDQISTNLSLAKSNLTSDLLVHIELDRYNVNMLKRHNNAKVQHKVMKYCFIPDSGPTTLPLDTDNLT